MTLRLKPAFEYPLPEVTELFNQAYRDYIVPIHFAPEVMAKGLRIHGIDLSTSQVVCRDEEAIGLGLLAHRGWTTRLAGMGIVPEHRHSGIGKWLLSQLLDQGRARGDRFWTLEVIEENKPAFQLYKNLGFTVHRRLVGFQAGSPDGEPLARLEEVDIHQVARLLIQTRPDDLPWQISGETLAQIGPPAQGFHFENGYAVIEDQGEQIEIMALVAPPDSQRRGVIAALLRGLFSRFPNRHWKVAARWLEEASEPFEELGFEKMPIAQKQMFLDLQQPGELTHDRQ